MPRHNFRTLRDAQAYIRDNNLSNAGIYYGNEGAGERTYEYPLEGIEVVAQRPQSAPPRYRYASSFDGSLQNVNDVINAMTGGIANRFDITQNARALYDTYQFARGNMSREDWQNSLVYGNNGIVSDRYAEEHPIMAMLANTAGGIGGNFGIASSKLAMLPFYNRTFTGVPNMTNIVRGREENMRKAFMKPKRDFTIWTADNPYYTQEFSKNFSNPKDNKVNEGIFTIFSLDRDNKVLKAPKTPKDVDELSWKSLPYDFYDNKLKFMPHAEKINITRTNRDPKTGNIIVDKNGNATKNVRIYTSSIDDNSTDYIVDGALFRGYDAIKLNKIMDGPWSNKRGVTEYKPINEIIYSPNANIIRIPGYRGRTSLAKHLIKNTNYTPAIYNSIFNAINNISR